MGRTTPMTDKTTIYNAGTLKLPAEPLKSDRTTEMVLIYNPAPRVRAMTYCHRPRMASRLLELGGVHDFEVDADGIERQCWRFEGPAEHDKAAAALAEARRKRDASWTATESASVNLLPGLTFVSSARWRLLMSQSGPEIKIKIRVAARLVESKGKGKGLQLQREAGVDWRAFARMITGDGHARGEAGTGDLAVLDRLLELDLDDVAIKAIERQRIEMRKTPKAA